jgi:uncharacterized protein
MSPERGLTGRRLRPYTLNWFSGSSPLRPHFLLRWIIIDNVYFCNILRSMKILPEPIAFQWDKGNIFKNAEKHDVTVQEAEEVFINDPFILTEDTKHSEHEQRFYGLGQTKTSRKLFVAFTIRDKKIRVISIRDMKKKERSIYERLEENS